jgi:hypothetical protein
MLGDKVHVAFAGRLVPAAKKQARGVVLGKLQNDFFAADFAFCKNTMDAFLVRFAFL